MKTMRCFCFSFTAVDLSFLLGMLLGEFVGDKSWKVWVPAVLLAGVYLAILKSWNES